MIATCIRRYCDKVAVMYAGQIVESGGSNEVFSQPQHPYTQALPLVIPGWTRTATSGSMRFQAMSRSMAGIPATACSSPAAVHAGRSAAARLRAPGEMDIFVRCSKAWEECRA